MSRSRSGTPRHRVAKIFPCAKSRLSLPCSEFSLRLRRSCTSPFRPTHSGPYFQDASPTSTGIAIDAVQQPRSPLWCCSYWLGWSQNTRSPSLPRELADAA